MIRSAWCPVCKTVVNAVLAKGKEVCPTCGHRLNQTSAG